MTDSPAVRLLNDCIRVSREDTRTLLLLFDRSGQEVAEEIMAATQMTCPGLCHAVYLPFPEQQWLATQSQLPGALLNCFSAASTLITCLTNSDAYTRCRVLLLDRARDMRLKILHMPGVTKDMFLRHTTKVDFMRLQTLALPIKAALDSATDVAIHTVDCRGENHILQLVLTGRTSHICGGIAMPGEIMNIPTGEVYIAPVEALSTGSIVLNGSTDHLVFTAKDDIVLHFNDGRLNLDKSRFSDSAVASQLGYDLKDEYARNPNSMFLCELGIGVNESIMYLSGDEILDEKAAGTIHIALGANKPFGGALDGTYHRDMILFPAKIICNGSELAVPQSPTGWRRNLVV